MKKLFYPIVCIIIIWFIFSTVEVWVHSLDVGYIYTRINVWAIMSMTTVEMRVVDCEIDKPTDTWLVTLEDIKGNQYQYYDDEIQYNGWIKEVTMQGNCVVNVR